MGLRAYFCDPHSPGQRGGIENANGRRRRDLRPVVLGPDPQLSGYAWFAGLGGHGMTAGVGAADLLAARLTGERDDISWASPALWATAAGTPC